jgi:hypothetical protein
MYAVIEAVNDQPTARMESVLTPHAIDSIVCSSRQEAHEVCSLWDTYRYMNKTISLADALNQVRQPDYPGANEVAAQYDRHVSHLASKYGNDGDPPYQRPDRS